MTENRYSHVLYFKMQHYFRGTELNFAISQKRHVAYKPGNKARTTRLRTRRPGHSVGLLCALCTAPVGWLLFFFRRKRLESSSSSCSIAAPRHSRSGVGCFQLKQWSNAIWNSQSSVPPSSLSHSPTPVRVGWGEKRNKVTPSQHYVTMPIAVRIFCKTRCLVWGSLHTRIHVPDLSEHNYTSTIRYN